MPLTILYRDEHYVAIDKPPGLLVHRSPISRDRVFALQTLRDQLGRHVYPIHRLDRATSGVLLFGLSADAARRLVRTELGLVLLLFFLGRRRFRLFNHGGRWNGGNGCSRQRRSRP